MSYTEEILRWCPSYWSTSQMSNMQEYLLNVNTAEFREIAAEARAACPCNRNNILSIKRIQNLHDLGQLLVREQLLVISKPNIPYYRVRRFIKIQKNKLTDALQHNLDHRRCDLTELVFEKCLSSVVRSNEVLIAVQVVTSNHQGSVRPTNNLEYFIDYVIVFQ